VRSEYSKFIVPPVRQHLASATGSGGAKPPADTVLFSADQSFAH